MKIYIDTDTFHAAPALYADAEKTKRLPTTIPVVEGWAQELSVGFLGSRQPGDGATVRLVLAPPGSAVEVARSTDGVRSADASGNALYAVLLSIDTSAMRALLDAARAKTLPLVAGVLVTDAGAGTRVEYQFRVSVSESVIGVWETPVSMSELNLALGETRAARDAAQRAQEGAETAQSGSVAAQAASEAARDEAKASEAASKASEISASESAESAAASARDAAESASLAGSRANAAETSAESASRSAKEAGASAANALQSERVASEYAETASDAAASATSAKTTAGQRAADAEASATAADESATAAQGSASAAATSASDASASAEAAQNSEAAAGTSSENAAGSAEEAGTSASNAAASASAAKVSETNASASASSAKDSAASAEASKNAAATSASDAAASATTASQQASSASTNAQNAAASATTAGEKAEAASTSAAAAKASETAAGTSATNASASASSAKTSEANASASAAAADAKAEEIAASAVQIEVNKTDIADLKSRVSTLENTAVGKIAYGRLFSSDLDISGKLIKIKVTLSDTGTPITSYTSGHFSSTDSGASSSWIDETGIQGTVWQILDTFAAETTEVDADYVSGEGWTSSTRDSVTTYLRAYDPANPGAFSKTASRQGISCYVEQVVATTTDDVTTYVKSTGTRTIDIDSSLGAENTWFKEIAPFSTARTKHIPVTIGEETFDNVMTEMQPVFMNRIRGFSLPVPVKDAETGAVLDTVEISGELWVFSCDEEMEFKAKVGGEDDVTCSLFRAPTFVDYDGVGTLDKGYFGRYEASKMTASTGAIIVSQPTHQNPLCSINRCDVLTYARRSNGGTNPEFAFNSRSWSIEPLEDLDLIAFLLVIMSGNRNTQATFTGRTGSATGVDLYASCGDCDPLLDENLAAVLKDFGYPDGVLIPGSFRARTSGISSFFFFVENPYGSKWKHRPDLDIRSLTDGSDVYGDGSFVTSGDYAYLFHCHDREKYDCYFHPNGAITRDGITYPANPHSARFGEENGYVNTGVKWPLGKTGGSYGTGAATWSEATPWMLLPVDGSGGSASAGIGDCFWTTAVANVTSMTSAWSMNYVITGGSFYSGAAAGAFALYCYYYWTTGTVSYGVRPSFSLQGQGSGATAQ